MHDATAQFRSMIKDSISGSRNPLTSFTIFAPASRAALATSARRESIDMSPFGFALRSALMTGMTRFFSSTEFTDSAPGRVDSPPTSIQSAPTVHIFNPRSIAESKLTLEGA